MIEERTLIERMLASAGGVERKRGARVQVLEGSASAVVRAYAHFRFFLPWKRADTMAKMVSILLQDTPSLVKLLKYFGQDSWTVVT